jgi:hypothetical protein
MLTISTDEAPRPLKLREGLDRRTQGDRRRSSVDIRLRVGLWYQYHRATRAGEFDFLPRNLYTRNKLQEALLPEMHKYEFSQRDNNSLASPSCALSAAVDFVWCHPGFGCNAASEPMAVYTVNAISEYLVRFFNVAVIDRRKADRRSPSQLRAVDKT